MTYEIIHGRVMQAAEQHGWRFQQPYENMLRMVVLRRRQGCNEEQVRFWMAEATIAQREEAFAEAMNIIEMENQLASE